MLVSNRIKNKTFSCKQLALKTSKNLKHCPLSEENFPLCHWKDARWDWTHLSPRITYKTRCICMDVPCAYWAVRMCPVNFPILFLPKSWVAFLTPRLYLHMLTLYRNFFKLYIYIFKKKIMHIYIYIFFFHCSQIMLYHQPLSSIDRTIAKELFDDICSRPSSTAS